MSDVRAKMQELLEMSVDVLLEKMSDPDVDAATINAARQLLKDNCIDTSLSASDTRVVQLNDASNRVPFKQPNSA